MERTETDRPEFKFLGGWLCLNFVDTMNWDSREPFYERFKTYSDLVWWNYEAGVLTQNEKDRLLQEAARYPANAAAVFEQAMALREVIYGVFSEIATGGSSGTAQLAALNTAMTDMLSQSCLVPQPNGFVWAWAGQADALERVMWAVVWSAAELLTSNKLDRIKRCAGESCGWLFLDTSRNRSRRWCEMKHCGNLAKARRYYKRRRAIQTGN